MLLIMSHSLQVILPGRMVVNMSRFMDMIRKLRRCEVYLRLGDQVSGDMFHHVSYRRSNTIVVEDGKELEPITWS